MNVFSVTVPFQFGIFGFTAYSPSKFAVRGFAETLFMEVKMITIAIICFLWMFVESDQYVLKQTNNKLTI